MKFLLVTVFTFVSLPELLWANAKVVGNGGNVIVCKDGGGKTNLVQLLDYFELQQSGGSLQLNPGLGDFSAILKGLFAKWKTVAPKRMEQYSKWLDSFQAEAGIYPGIQIPPTEDTGVIGIPTGCGIQPAAFQRPDQEILPGVKRYTINKDLWDQMPEIQRAGLVLHELIYREAIQALHETSFPTRYLNGYLSSANPDADTYASIVSQMPLKWVEYGSGMLIKIGDIFTGDSGIPAYSRTGDISSNGNVESRMAQIFANVSTKHLKMEFENPIPHWYISIEYTSDYFTLETISQEDEFKLRHLFVEQKQYSVDIVSAFAANRIDFQKFHEAPDRYSSISITIEPGYDGNVPSSLKLNPANSFYIQPDGSRISSIIKLLPGEDDMGETTLGAKLQTASGETWVHIREKPGNTKK